MTPLRFEEARGPARIRYHRVPTGTGSCPPGLFFLFAAVFLFFGILVILGTHGYIPHTSKSKAPDWVWGFIGYTFTLVGIGALVGAYWSVREGSRRLKVAPDQPAMMDYPWDTAKFEVSGWRPVFENAAFAIIFTVFLVPFNWFCFAQSGEWKSNLLAKIAIGIFDSATLLMWFQVVKKLLQVNKFGTSRIEFARFPFPIDQRVSLRFVPPPSVNSLRSGTFMLRCVDRWTESYGSGDNRRTNTIQEAKWSGTWHLDDGSAFIPGETIELSFDPPPDLPPSFLSGPRYFFWELEIKLDVPGLDFEGLYLVPVYGSVNQAVSR